MSIIPRFSDGDGPRNPGAGYLQPNASITDPLGVALLLPRRLVGPLTEATNALRSYHPSMRQARCQFADVGKHGEVSGLLGWGEHVIRVAGACAPMPAEDVEACVGPAHYDAELKESARKHQSHLVLLYAGYDTSPLEQYVALAAAAGSFLFLNPLVVLNANANTSLPAGILAEDIEGDRMRFLRSLPFPSLYCGFTKYQVEGVEGVWMRSFGAPRLGLPDLAAHAESHDEGQRFFDIFDNILGYLYESGAELAPGHTMQVEQEYVRLRETAKDEEFLEIGTELLVVELIRPDEINEFISEPN